MYEMTVPPSIKALRNLSHCLEKAAAFADSKKAQMETLLNARLAIDQFPLTRQIQIACDTAKIGAGRLTGVTPPVHEDKETTLAEVQSRIHSTISFLETLNKDNYKEAASRKISNPRFWENKWMTGEEFAQHHLLPNLYFHVTTAYSIMRHYGVEVGKQDYLGQMPFKQ